MGRIMSEAEIRRRKKVQGHISQTTGALGLAGVGVGTAAALASKKPGALKAIRKVPGLKKTTSEGLKDTGLYTSLASGGIGGAGSFNFASYTGAESRKRKPSVVGQPPSRVKKADDMGLDLGYFGDEGNQGVIEKAWQPVASSYDSEASRKKRGKLYETGAAAAGGAGATVAGVEGIKAVKAAKKIKSMEMAPVVERTNSAGEKYKIGLGSQAEKAIPTEPLKALRRHGGKAAAGLAAVGGAAATHSALKRKRQGSWQSYGKRDTTSAFGIDHDTEWTAP